MDNGEHTDSPTLSTPWPPVISNAQYAISNMPWRIDKVVFTRDAFDDGEYNKKNVTASAQRGFGSSRPCKSISGAWVRTAYGRRDVLDWICRVRQTRRPGIVWYTRVEQAIKNWEGKKNLQLPPVFQFSPIYWRHMPFFDLQLRSCMLWPMTIMSLKATGLQLSVDIVLTSRQIR